MNNARTVAGKFAIIGCLAGLPHVTATVRIHQLCRVAVCPSLLRVAP